MVSNQNADSPLSKKMNHPLNIGNRNRVNSGKRLIQKEKFRLQGKGAGNFRSAPLTAGKGKGLLLADSSNRKLVYQALKPVPLFTGRQILAGFQNRPDIFLNRKLSENRRLLRQVGNSQPGPLIHRKPCNAHIIKKNLARRRLVKSNHHIKSRGFSGPVRPQQSQNLADLHGKLNAAHNFLAAERFI